MRRDYIKHGYIKHGYVKRSIFAVGLLLSVSLAFALLPPRYQNEQDLSVMLDFIHQYPNDVLAKLKRINLDKKTVEFDHHCVATFVRAPKKPSAKMLVGPATDLVLSKSSCKVAH